MRPARDASRICGTEKLLTPMQRIQPFARASSSASIIGALSFPSRGQ
jgi:hypothetical protein